MTSTAPISEPPGLSEDDPQVQRAVAILEAQRTMAISTVRPDGWPQTTIVGYASEGLDVYFMILCSSQKYGNIQRDNRVSMAVGDQPADLSQAKAVFAGANAVEITNTAERRRAWVLLEQRHPNLRDFALPQKSEAAVMRAMCRHVSVVDYTVGIGHTEAFTVESRTPQKTLNLDAVSQQ